MSCVFSIELSRYEPRVSLRAQAMHLHYSTELHVFPEYVEVVWKVVYVLLLWLNRISTVRPTCAQPVLQCCNSCNI